MADVVCCIFFLVLYFVSTQNLQTRIASAPPVRWQRAWTATRGEVGSKDYMHVLYIHAYCIMLYNMHIPRAGRFCQLCSTLFDVDICDTGCIKPLADHGIEELEEGWCFLENLQVSIRYGNMGPNFLGRFLNELISFPGNPFCAFLKLEQTGPKQPHWELLQRCRVLRCWWWDFAKFYFICWFSVQNLGIL